MQWFANYLSNPEFADVGPAEPRVRTSRIADTWHVLDRHGAALNRASLPGDGWRFPNVLRKTSTKCEQCKYLEYCGGKDTPDERSCEAPRPMSVCVGASRRDDSPRLGRALLGHAGMLFMFTVGLGLGWQRI